MPQIAEIRMIDDAVWARIPVSGDDGRVQLLTDAEMTANDQKMARLLNEIERLRAALINMLDDGDSTDRAHARRVLGLAVEQT